MPYRAKNQGTGETLKIETYASPKVDLHGVNVVCPFCDEPMIIRGGIGRLVTAHFSHKSSCAARFAHEKGGESAEHRVAKQYFLNELRRTNAQEVATGAIHYDMEVTLKRDGVWRVIDVAEMTTDGTILRAFEIQLSHISLDDLQARTSDYESFGIQTVWIFDMAGRRDEQKEWCLRNGGVYGEVKVEYRARTTQDVLKVGGE